MGLALCGRICKGGLVDTNSNHFLSDILKSEIEATPPKNHASVDWFGERFKKRKCQRRKDVWQSKQDRMWRKSKWVVTECCEEGVSCDAGGRPPHVCLALVCRGLNVNQTSLVLDPVHPDTPPCPSAGPASNWGTFVERWGRRREYAPDVEEESVSP